MPSMVRLGEKPVQQRQSPACQSRPRWGLALVSTSSTRENLVATPCLRKVIFSGCAARRRRWTRRCLAFFEDEYVKAGDNRLIDFLIELDRALPLGCSP